MLTLAVRDELARLRRENKQLRLERDILSRAAPLNAGIAAQAALAPIWTAARALAQHGQSAVAHAGSGLAVLLVAALRLDVATVAALPLRFGRPRAATTGAFGQVLGPTIPLRPRRLTAISTKSSACSSTSPWVSAASPRDSIASTALRIAALQTKCDVAHVRWLRGERLATVDPGLGVEVAVSATTATDYLGTCQVDGLAGDADDSTSRR